MNRCRVEPIADHLELIPIVAEWHWRAWGHADPGGSLASWTTALERSAARDRIPILLVGLIGSEPVGSVSLVENDMDTTRPEWRPVVERWRRATPWLSGLYVVSGQRRRGIGSALIHACEQQAVALGVRRLYLYTSAAERLYLRHGYAVIGRESYEGERVAVMAKDLDRKGGRAYGRISGRRSRARVGRRRRAMPSDLTVRLENRPGTVAAAAEALGRAGVNIEGGCGVAAGDQGVLHVLVEDADAARRALSDAGFEVGLPARDVPDEPGALGRVARRIADAGVNLEALYPTAGGRVVFCADDVGRARQAASGG